jgi:hypothetical protein
MALNGIASDDSYWKKIKEKENKMSNKYVSPEFMKSYEKALEKAFKDSGITVSSNTQYSSGRAEDGTMWYAAWDNSGNYGGGGSGHLITEKDFIPTKIIYSCPATICYFPDGTKEVVKVAADEEYIKEEGVAECIMRKIFKSRRKFLKAVEAGYENQESEVERVLHNGSVDKIKTDKLYSQLKAFTSKLQE